MEFKLIDHCKIEFTDDREDIEHGLVRVTGATATIAVYDKATVTLSDGRTVPDDHPDTEETGRTSVILTLEQVEMKSNGRRMSINGFLRGTETPVAAAIIPDLRRCQNCG